MAFVVKSKRKCNEKIVEADELGPGEYLQQTTMKKIMPSKVAFMTTTLKRNNYSSDNPGPGEYYQDYTQMNYIKNISKDHNFQEQVCYMNDSSLTKSAIEKLGFMNKDKRFKFYEPKQKNPGPGVYFPSLCSKIQTFNRTRATVLKEAKERKPRLIIALKKKSSVRRLPMTQDYGFEVLANGRLIKKHNPELYKTFSSEKGTAGAGCYEIDNSKKWHNTSTEWNKFKANRMKQQLNHSINKGSVDNSKGQLMLSLNTTSCTDIKPLAKPKISHMKCKIVKGSIINNKLNQSLKEQKQKELSQQLIKEKATFINKLDFETQNNISPGPGYYYDFDNMTSFKIKPKPEVNQFFGSKKERFPSQKDVSHLDPAMYFQSINKDKETYNKQYEKEYQNRRKQNKAAFSTTQNRFNESEIVEDIPGPGYYELEKINVNSSKSLIKGLVKFGSTEKRFGRVEEKLKNAFTTPGPGSYFGLTFSSSKLDDKVNWKRIISGTGEKMQNQSTSNQHQFKLSRHSKEVSPNAVPPVGLYNPDIVYTIDYKIKKNANAYIPSEIAFNSTVPKNFKPIKKSSSGPGYYYKEKQNELQQIFPPFHHSENRQLDNSIPKNTIGPGDYNSDSYFNWNKKTFNTNYV